MALVVIFADYRWGILEPRKLISNVGVSEVPACRPPDKHGLSDTLGAGPMECRCSSCLTLINEGLADFPASERKKPLVLDTRGFTGCDYYGRLAGRLMTPPPSAGS